MFDISLTDAERMRISAAVHQNCSMPEVFGTIEAIINERLEQLAEDLY